jgi:hypothetical protein
MSKNVKKMRKGKEYRENKMKEANRNFKGNSNK